MHNKTIRSALSTLLFLACLLTFTIARADSTEDDYLRIYSIIDDADSLSAKGKEDLAKSKYAEAQRELLAFKKSNPTWNTKTVAYRLSYVAEKLAPKAEVPAKTEPLTATTKPRTDTKSSSPAADGPKVKMLSLGSEPRTVLRLHPAAGQKQSVKLTMKMEMDMGSAGAGMPAMNMPATKIEADVTVRSVASNGDISYDLIFTDAGIEGGADESDPIAAAMSGGIGKLKGTTAAGVITERGATKSMNFKASQNADPASRQSLRQSKEAFSQVTFPVEAIGVGAKWEVKEKKKTQGVTLEETSTFEITAIKGDEIKLKTIQKQSADSQKAENPAMPGMKMDLTKLHSEGTGTATVNLSKVMPVLLEFKLSNETTMSINLGGEDQAMTMKMDATVRMESK